MNTRVAQIVFLVSCVREVKAAQIHRATIPTTINAARKSNTLGGKSSTPCVGTITFMFGHFPLPIQRGWLGEYKILKQAGFVTSFL